MPSAPRSPGRGAVLFARPDHSPAPIAAARRQIRPARLAFCDTSEPLPRRLGQGDLDQGDLDLAIAAVRPDSLLAVIDTAWTLPAR